jgi:hypothetical protein
VESGCVWKWPWEAAVLKRLCPVAVAEAMGIGCPDMAGRGKRLCLEVAVGGRFAAVAVAYGTTFA